MTLDFEDEQTVLLFKSLSDRNVRYMLVGGWAVNYYGYVRATQDLDIWIAPTNENKLPFCQTLIDVGYTEEEIEDIKNQDFTRYFMCTVWLDRGISVDCLTIMHKSLSFDEAEIQMITFEIKNNIKVKIVSYEFLREMKIRANRYKDLEDIKKLDEIMALKNKTKND